MAMQGPGQIETPCGSLASAGAGARARSRGRGCSASLVLACSTPVTGTSSATEDSLLSACLSPLSAVRRSPRISSRVETSKHKCCISPLCGSLTPARQTSKPKFSKLTDKLKNNLTEASKKPRVIVKKIKIDDLKPPIGRKSKETELPEKENDQSMKLRSGSELNYSASKLTKVGDNDNSSVPLETIVSKPKTVSEEKPKSATATIENCKNQLNSKLKNNSLNISQQNTSATATNENVENQGETRVLRNKTVNVSRQNTPTNDKPKTSRNPRTTTSKEDNERMSKQSENIPNLPSDNFPKSSFVRRKLYTRYLDLDGIDKEKTELSFLENADVQNIYEPSKRTSKSKTSIANKKNVYSLRKNDPSADPKATKNLCSDIMSIINTMVTASVIGNNKLEPEKPNENESSNCDEDIDDSDLSMFNVETKKKKGTKKSITKKSASKKPETKKTEPKPKEPTPELKKTNFKKTDAVTRKKWRMDDEADENPLKYEGSNELIKMSSRRIPENKLIATKEKAIIARRKAEVADDDKYSNLIRCVDGKWITPSNPTKVNNPTRREFIYEEQSDFILMHSGRNKSKFNQMSLARRPRHDYHENGSETLSYKRLMGTQNRKPALSIRDASSVYAPSVNGSETFSYKRLMGMQNRNPAMSIRDASSVYGPSRYGLELYEQSLFTNTSRFPERNRELSVIPAFASESIRSKNIQNCYQSINDWTREIMETDVDDLDDDGFRIPSLPKRRKIETRDEDIIYRSSYNEFNPSTTQRNANFSRIPSRPYNNDLSSFYSRNHHPRKPIDRNSTMYSEFGNSMLKRSRVPFFFGGNLVSKSVDTDSVVSQKATIREDVTFRSISSNAHSVLSKRYENKENATRIVNEFDERPLNPKNSKPSINEPSRDPNVTVIQRNVDPNVTVIQRNVDPKTTILHRKPDQNMTAIKKPLSSVEQLFAKHNIKPPKPTGSDILKNSVPQQSIAYTNVDSHESTTRCNELMRENQQPAMLRLSPWRLRK